MWNISYRKVGGLHLIKIGRLFFSFAVTAEYKPIKKPPTKSDWRRVVRDNPIYATRGRLNPYN